MSGSIYTRGGDAGETSLSDGSRVAKHGARVEAYGTVDEANSAVGFVRTKLAVVGSEKGAELDMQLDFVQHKLFNCSSRLATPPEHISDKTPAITPEDVTRLERAIDAMDAELDELHAFVLPGGCEEACRLHMARTIVRRAERRITKLGEIEPVDPNVQAFVNRLSDYLFTAARYANKLYRAEEYRWDPNL
jgi:cob(I)alamin adenosyltransferase